MFQKQNLTAEELLAQWSTLKVKLDDINMQLLRSLARQMRKRENSLLKNAALLASVYADPRYKVILNPVQDVRGIPSWAHPPSEHKKDEQKIWKIATHFMTANGQGIDGNLDEEEFVRTASRNKLVQRWLHGNRPVVIPRYYTSPYRIREGLCTCKRKWTEQQQKAAESLLAQGLLAEPVASKFVTGMKAIMGYRRLAAETDKRLRRAESIEVLNNQIDEMVVGDKKAKQ
ncbi:unnamed protein product [Cyprideis torosa]|uniref:Uncharacterized protein n=1 Tax=Cyprideis torosa TaxID=163714 RepID=A0A7R8ZKX9_9CRUS|nr:unnamed protein product [Cyprideis torosa]CAG0892131.1 unnamed protein product [Cyprideis torosa]